MFEYLDNHPGNAFDLKFSLGLQINFGVVDNN
jgi:hypothetical protein